MSDKAKVYAQTILTRQLAGDIAESIKPRYNETEEDNKLRTEKADWQTIEDLLLSIEKKIEKMHIERW